jgi:hypothetical protein
MSKGMEDVRITDECKECKHWDRVGHRVRVRSLLTSMADKLEVKVMANEFKPTIGDFLKVLDAKTELDQGNEGPKEITVKWGDLTPASTN